jgi:ribosome-associated heat shock protein Hsp15
VVDKQRIDKWLFFARVMKSRTLAGKLADAGKVRVNGDKIGSASALIKIDDVLTMSLERKILVYKIVAFGERRGPYIEAQELYEDLSPPVVKSPTVDYVPAPALREPGAGRPTKKERREMDKFRSQDER